MELSHPLRSLVPSLDSAVLEVLAGSESAFGPTHVARLAGRGSRPGIQLVLDRLVEHGLVIAEPVTRGHMYRLNRRHLLTPSILSALAARHELFARLEASVRTLTPTPAHASVFGSFARADATPDSDVDVLLIMASGFSANDAWEQQMRHFEDDVYAWTGNRLEMVVFDVACARQAQRSGEPLFDELRHEGMTLIGPPLDSVLAADVTGVKSGRQRLAKST